MTVIAKQVYIPNREGEQFAWFANMSSRVADLSGYQAALRASCLLDYAADDTG
jgi:hypothetical protein